MEGGGLAVFKFQNSTDVTMGEYTFTYGMYTIMLTYIPPLVLVAIVIICTCKHLHGFAYCFIASDVYVYVYIHVYF